MKSKPRNNPHLDDIAEYIQKNSVAFEIIGEGGEAKAYLFQINKSLVLNAKLLYPGVYVLKDYIKYENFKGLSLHKINKLTELSKYGVIPKIYIITKNYIIMDYVKGTSLKQIMNNYGPNSVMVRKLRKRILELEEIWFNNLKFDKYDVTLDRSNYNNFIIADGFEFTEKPKVYIIDPRIYGSVNPEIHNFWSLRFKNRNHGH